MKAYSVAISGLTAAQQALEVLGNNIANAATEGYHRQRIELSPAYSSQIGTAVLGGGVDVVGVTRAIDKLLEVQILLQRSSLEQVSQEGTTLQSVENAFAELSGGSSLSTAIDGFFAACQDLCAHPSESIWQNNVITAAESLAAQFQVLAKFLSDLQSQITLEAQNIAGQINALTNQIAELNDKIEQIEISGKQANNLSDQRDRKLTELAELIGIQTQSREHGVVDVAIGGIPVVSGTCATEIQVCLQSSGLLGLAPAGAQVFQTNVQGGKLGAYFSLKNEIVRGISDDLDALAFAIIQKVNQYHVQAVGSEGSFTELTGWVTPGENLTELGMPVTDGEIYIRVINTETGQITRHRIEVDVSEDSLSSIAADISAITGLDASVVSSQLCIRAEANYKFDFLPAVLPQPTASNLTGTSPPAVSISGIYTGTENQTFTCTVKGTGSVGNGSLQLEVRDSKGQVVTARNIGAGYAAADDLDVGNGIRIALGAGNLNDGDSFEIDAFANTDTSGLLSAVGLNTFFSGKSALDIAVCSRIADSPAALGAALGSDLTDNTNAMRMAGVKDEAIDSLVGMTVKEFYRRLTTDIGQQVSVKQMQQENLELMVQNLSDQQSEISGVDINDEAAQLLIFEQMFQAMAKYLTTIQSSLLTLMEIV